MAGPGRRLMTRSNLALARRALALAQAALPPYSHRNSPKKFTQHRLFAILAVRQALPLDNRGAEQLLKDWSDLRQVLGMARLRQVSSAGAHAPMLFTTGNEVEVSQRGPVAQGIVPRWRRWGGGQAPFPEMSCW